ncbi:MAG TPA: hypothetical protein PKH94_09395, partial [Bacteroidales bacterium]|nr:hypothetical protein [Bacteroidales bacterium]
RGCIIVHGTGHVGKPPAIRYGYVQSGTLPPEERLIALTIKDRLRLLNGHLVRTLQSASIPALGMDIMSYYDELADRRVQNGFIRTLGELIDRQQVPVFYGDMICRPDGSFKVVSSDFIALVLARILRPENVIFLTDVPGVYQEKGTGDDQKDKKIIPLLTPANIDSMERTINDGADVSGGMRKKAEIALEISRYCARCFIGSGYQDHVLGDFLSMRPVMGTFVKV